MPATRTITTLSATFTQTQLRDFLITAFSNAGFGSPFDNYSSGNDLLLVYELTINGSATFGKTYLRIRISNTFIIYQQIFSAWNTGTKTGSNGSTEVTYSTLSNTVNLVANAFSSAGNSGSGATEYRLVLLTQGSIFIPLGILAPVTRRGSWNLNSWNWGYLFTSNSMNVLRSSTLNPYSNADNDIALSQSTRLATANTTDNERDLIAPITVLTQSNTGIAGQTSTDFAIVSANGSTRYDQILRSGSSEVYLALTTGNGGLAIRIT